MATSYHFGFWAFAGGKAHFLKTMESCVLKDGSLLSQINFILFFFNAMVILVIFWILLCLGNVSQFFGIRHGSTWLELTFTGWLPSLNCYRLSVCVFVEEF